jgi:hypothetical protein
MAFIVVVVQKRKYYIVLSNVSINNGLTAGLNSRAA